ncbi:alpha/beta hydrolase family protein [Nocardia callitridis]
MRRAELILTACGALLSVFVTTLAAPVVSARPDCGTQVATVPVTLTVDGEAATGLVYEPYRCEPGDLPPRDLVVSVHGHDSSAASNAEYQISIARRTETPILAMDLRSATGTWRTGEWNLWAGWRDVVEATRWYRGEHPEIAKTVLWGGSQGGIVSGLAAAYAPDGLFDYWVDNYGPADDFTSWLAGAQADPALPTQIERDAGGCTPLECPLAYAERSPALLADRIHVRRTFLVHGTGDAVVPYVTSLEMRAALAAAGRPVSMYTIVSGTDLQGAVVPGDHSIGPAYFEGGCVVERLLDDSEPLDGPDKDYFVDVARGVRTAPPAPPNAKCAA